MAMHPFEKMIEKTGITYAMLAKEIGISPQFLCDLVKGRARPSLETMVEITRVTGVTAEDLMDWERADLS